MYLVRYFTLLTHGQGEQMFFCSSELSPSRQNNLIQESPLHSTSAEITATSGPAVAVLLRHIGARGARDVTRAPYWGPRGARCNWLLNSLR